MRCGSNLFQDVCRALFCPVGEFLKEYQCEQPMKNFSGMPVHLGLKISPESNSVRDVTEKEMLSLHAAIEKRLHKIVRHAY